MLRLLKKLVLIACLALPVAACADMNGTPVGAPVQEYRLGPGDQLRIIVFGHDEMSGQFFVNSSGNVAVPLIPDVKAEGLTVAELEKAITNALEPNYIQNAKVSVEVIEYRPVYILGEVRTPGKYPYVPGMTLLQAVAIAGGHTYRANENSAQVTRRVGDTMREFEVGPNDFIEPGDTVFIKRRWF